jgi:hypothetical protein
MNDERAPCDLDPEVKPEAAVDLYWIPAGAGANVVRISSKLFEAVSAFAARRPRCDLYHSVLAISESKGHFIIELAPVPDLNGELRGVLAEGPVATRWLSRFRVFRYEIRLWLEGEIPDIDYAIASPVRITDDAKIAEKILDTLPSIPTPVWGRDEFDTGEMWNSNSVISWVLARSGVSTESIHPPANGRAPGWDAGLALAAQGLS